MVCPVCLRASVSVCAPSGCPAATSCGSLIRYQLNNSRKKTYVRKICGTKGMAHFLFVCLFVF